MKYNSPNDKSPSYPLKANKFPYSTYCASSPQ
nr:MAG TPA: hypothetical protein [Caudoviricetes sp.]